MPELRMRACALAHCSESPGDSVSSLIRSVVGLMENIVHATVQRSPQRLL
jgi:hypothetical protein